MNSVTSCWMNLKFGLPPRWEMLSTDPVTKLSMPITLWPRDSSRSVRCDPRKPAAPVTTEVGLDFPLLILAIINVRRDLYRMLQVSRRNTMPELRAGSTPNEGLGSLFAGEDHRQRQPENLE